MEVEKETHPIRDAKSVELSDGESTKEKEVSTVEWVKPDDDDVAFLEVIETEEEIQSFDIKEFKFWWRMW